MVTLRPAISLAGLLPRVEPPALTARLRHTFNVPTHNTVQITFEVRGGPGPETGRRRLETVALHRRRTEA